MEEHVSVVLPYFNRRDTIGSAVLSVLQQTHRELTLYLIDDGSSDGSRALAESFDDDRIIHVSVGKNVGVCRARNIGISRAEGSLLAFMDSDDAWLPGKLAAQIAWLRAAQEHDPKTAVAGCGWRYMGNESVSRSFAAGPFSRKEVLLDGVAGIGTPMLLVDRSVAVGGAAFDPLFPALVDRDYVMSCLANETKVTIVPEVHALVRRGRRDHVANSERAAVAYGLILDKYASELSERSDIRSWYSFRACRESCLHGSLASALKYLPSALRYRTLRRALHLSLGALGRGWGLALAQKVAPL